MLTGNVHENDSFLSAVQKSGTGSAGAAKPVCAGGAVLSQYTIFCPPVTTAFRIPGGFFGQTDKRECIYISSPCPQDGGMPASGGPGRREK